MTRTARFDIAEGLDPRTIDALEHLRPRGGLYGYEARCPGKFRNRAQIYPGDDEGWTMEKVLVFLNNLGDDWCCRRRGRIEEMYGRAAFTCTFRHLSFEEFDVHIVWPLPHDRRDGGRFDLPGPPEVWVSYAWIMNNPGGHDVPASREEDDAQTGEGDDAQTGGGDVIEEGDEPPEEDDPDEGEMTPEGRNDLFERASPEDSAEPDDDEAPRIECAWECTTHSISEFFDDRHRPRKKLQTRDRINFTGRFPRRESSSYIWQNDLLLLHDWREFSGPMRYFAQKFPLQRGQYREPTLEILLASLQVMQTIPAPNHSPQDFLGLPGLLGLDIAPPSFGERLQTYTYQDKAYSILSGYWVSPLAKSIIEGNEIDGLIMDTTFRVMSQYYTAILVAVSHNVGIPLAISFGSSESIELYDTFYRVFETEFGIKLDKYILESDQGPALRAVGARHPRHLFCLRNVLKTLHAKNCGRFASLVGNLISARSTKELNLLQKLYAPDFTEVCAEGGPQMAQLVRCLKKVGLQFINGDFVYTDPFKTRWNQVSMLARVGTRMPSTSNTIESLNGRLNGRTPRYNCFWGSMHRLREAIMKKTESFIFSVRHNLNYETRKAQRRSEHVPAGRMQREMQFFWTSERACLCGETVLASEMHRRDVRCSHRLAYWRLRHAGERFVPTEGHPGPIQPLNLSGELVPCVVRENLVTRPVFAPGDPAGQIEREHLVKLIVRDAHAQKRRDEVREFVETHLGQSAEFALGESASFLDVHRAGVTVFRGNRTPPAVAHAA
jgi:hypothetical protein